MRGLNITRSEFEGLFRVFMACRTKKKLQNGMFADIGKIPAAE